MAGVDNIEEDGRAWRRPREPILDRSVGGVKFRGDGIGGDVFVMGRKRVPR